MTIRGRILAIDDEGNIRRLLTNELEQEGFRVATAATGEQGLALADKEPFDLALVDLKLPGMSGIDVIRKIRHMPSPVDAIVITGHGDVDVAVQSMKLGAMDHRRNRNRGTQRGWDLQCLLVSAGHSQ